VVVEPLPDAQCRAVVQIERQGVGLHSATAQGGSQDLDMLRTVARATADAVSEAFATDGIKVRIRGVQRVEAFAQIVMVVSVIGNRGAKTQTLLGVCDASDDLARGVALAVLNGTNRFLGTG
jgi:hypothetical protein